MKVSVDSVEALRNQVDRAASSAKRGNRAASIEPSGRRRDVSGSSSRTRTTTGPSSSTGSVAQVPAPASAETRRAVGLVNRNDPTKTRFPAAR